MGLRKGDVTTQETPWFHGSQWCTPLPSFRAEGQEMGSAGSIYEAGNSKLQTLLLPQEQTHSSTPVPKTEYEQVGVNQASM